MNITLYTDLERCHIQNKVLVKQCQKCSQYNPNHKLQDCTNEKICNVCEVHGTPPARDIAPITIYSEINQQPKKNLKATSIDSPSILCGDSRRPVWFGELTNSSGHERQSIIKRVLGDSYSAIMAAIGATAAIEKLNDQHSRLWKYKIKMFLIEKGLRDSMFRSEGSQDFPL
ncbi:hypothetical protein LAZ67_6004100 [Cordylochernes scorpioides]|uniref:Uncharacterized protein n=1 Tax=Cordylochernes scorpioides TaxID=51811 RepID=A0ABY6KN27_9ARAC|nr:hypothetical protein LAZ67_6004100 [Cordylochernes scorpioides]